MNDDRLRELMADAVADVEASDALRAKVSDLAAHEKRRRLPARGWIAVLGAGLAAAAVLLVVPLIRPSESAPPAPGGQSTMSTPTGPTPVDDIGEVLGDRTWYVIGIVAQGVDLTLDVPSGNETAMRIQLTGDSLQGHDGCNWIRSDPALLTSAPAARVNITSTAMLCTPVPSGQDAFLAALRSGPKSWSRVGDAVILTAAGIEVSFGTDRYIRPLSSSASRPTQADVVQLLGTRTWYVTHILASRAPVRLSQPTDPGRAMRIGIERGSLEGFDGCNWLGASPAILSQGADATVGLSATDVGCTPRPEGQYQFVKALGAGDKSWSERDGELILRAGGYEITFSSSPPRSSTSSSPTG